VSKFVLVVAALVCSIAVVPAQDRPGAPGELSDTQVEQFLAHARVIHQSRTRKGVTGSIRATLTDGKMTHDAHIQAIDEHQEEFQGFSGTQRNFRDSWSYNVAAYRLDRLLGLNLVPVSVARRWGRGSAAFTWWVDDVLMDEAERLTKRISAPDTERWNEQLQLLRVFNQLIANADPNFGNVLITKDWRIWAIDHTRAFRLTLSVKTPENITRCDRQVLERMKALDEETLQKAIGPYTYTTEIAGLLARRDEIVRILEKAGPSALFDRR
jgi:hypothetical protein